MLKEFLEQNHIYMLPEAASILGMNIETLKRQCQRGKHDALCLAGKVWLVRLPRKRIKNNEQQHEKI